MEGISEVAEARHVLYEEFDRYNKHQVHSTTGEIPSICFERAIGEGNSLFRPFSIRKPYTSRDDVFCLRVERMINAYRRVSLFGHEIQVPNAPLWEYVDIHMVPDLQKNIMKFRIWCNECTFHSLTLPLEGFRVYI